MKSILVLCIVLVLLLFILVIIQINNYKKRVSAEIMMEEKLKQNNMFDGHYGKIYSDNRSLRYIRHELAKHMAVTSEPEFGNDTDGIVGLIIRSKAKAAVKKGISFNTDLKSFDTDIKTPDMVSLLTNLLDNAIEACCRSGKSEKNIFLTVDKGLIEIINDKDESEAPIDDDFSTTKPEKELHGFGMNIIKDIVKKYDGRLDMKDEGDKFKTVVKF